MQKTDANLVPQVSTPHRCATKQLIMSVAQFNDGSEYRRVLGMQLSAKMLQLQMHSCLNVQGEKNG